MTNCSNEQVLQNDTPQYSEAKLWFNNHKDDYSATVLKYVKNLQWEEAIVTDGNIGEVLEIPFSFEDNLSVSNKKGNLRNVNHRLMFVKDDEKGYKLFYVQIFTDQEKSKILDKNFNYYNIKNNFDGKVFLQELATNITSKIEFRNGNKIMPSLTSRMAEEVIECVWLGYWDESGHFEPIELVYCDGGGSEELPTPGYGGSGGGSSSSGGTTTSTTIAQKIENRIVSDNLKPCQKEILEMLKGATNADIASMFTKLGTTKIYTVTFNAENPIDGTPAATTRVSQYNYKIQISNDYTSATNLFRAGNMLHELGHAYFMSIKDDYSSTTPPNPAVFNDFPTLFKGYVEKKYPNMYDAHHIEMANQYIDAIAVTLREYNRYADPNGTVPYQVYTDLAWGGLKGTPVFEEKFPLGTPERLRIDNRYATEQSGNPVGYSSGQLQSAVGKPCN